MYPEVSGIDKIREVEYNVKKVVSLIASVMVCFALSTSALAVDNGVFTAEVTVVNLSNEITDEMLQEIVNSTSACLISEDGTTIPIDSVVTVEDVTSTEEFEFVNSDIIRDASVPCKAYKVAVSAKASDKTVVDSGSKNGSGYNGSATLELVWVDGPGLNNVIKKVSGSVTCYNNTTVEDAYVAWGNGWQSQAGWPEVDLTSKFANATNGKKVEYEEWPDETVPCPKAISSTLFKGASSYLSLSASSSVFQGS